MADHDETQLKAAKSIAPPAAMIEIIGSTAP